MLFLYRKLHINEVKLHQIKYKGPKITSDRGKRSSSQFKGDVWASSRVPQPINEIVKKTKQGL